MSRRPDSLAPRTWSVPTRLLAVAGCIQLLGCLTPAARVRLLGTIPFYRLPTAGTALGILGALTLAVALHPRSAWRWLPAILTLLVLGVTRWRLRFAPSDSFIDPALRHLIRPAWGFGVMSVAVLLSVVGAALARRVQPPAPPALPGDEPVASPLPSP